MPVVPLVINRENAECVCNDSVQTGIDPEIALQHDGEDALSVHLMSGGLHLFACGIKSLFCLYVLGSDSQSVHDLLVEHDAAVAALFHHVNPDLVVRRKDLAVVFGFHVAGIGVPVAVNVCESLPDICREILEQMGIGIIGFQEGLHIPDLVRRYQLLIHVGVRDGHHVRKLSGGQHQPQLGGCVRGRLLDVQGQSQIFFDINGCR